MFNGKLLLGSRSPRRKWICTYLFGDLEILQGLQSEPTWNQKENPETYLERCASAKWNNAFEQCTPSSGHSLLVADTTVVIQKRLLEKPESPSHAKKMLADLSGRTHQVLTAFKAGVWGEGGEFEESATRIITSLVTFRKLSTSEINAYVKTGDCLDKAGAYGAQGLAVQFIEKISGSYWNVMGLPYTELKNTFLDLGLKWE